MHDPSSSTALNYTGSPERLGSKGQRRVHGRALLTLTERPHLVDMQVIVRHQDQEFCASITCMIRHYVARRAKVIFDHPHNAAFSVSLLVVGRLHGA
jgi:hypothetical protein